MICVLEAEYGIATPSTCDVTSHSNKTCRLPADRSQSVTSCMLSDSCRVEGEPVTLQHCGKHSNYLQLQYQCLDGK